MSADKVYQNVTVIVAVAANLAIGRDNTIPWHLRADLQYFKQTSRQNQCSGYFGS